MFIYKITNIENNLCYIGLDTYPEYKQKRWKDHQRNCLTSDTKFYIALKDNVDKFTFEIIDRADNIVDLAFKEIYWIDYYNSFKKGYNSTRGGDGLNQDLSQFTEEEIFQLKQLYSFTMTEYNYNVKWKDKTADERKELTAHLNTTDIIKKRTETLKKFYDTNPDIKKEKGKAIVKWQLENKIQLCKTNRHNGIKGAEKVSKKVRVEFQDGTTKIYNSKSEFNRENGEIINAILRKTKENKSHRGFKGWEI